MIEPHQDDVRLSHSFDDAWTYLKKIDGVDLLTSVGTQFMAISDTTKDSRHVIRFFQKGKEYGRAYQCCWGHYYNCNRTRIGMYEEALDESI